LSVNFCDLGKGIKIVAMHLLSIEHTPIRGDHLEGCDGAADVGGSLVEDEGEVHHLAGYDVLDSDHLVKSAEEEHHQRNIGQHFEGEDDVGSG
jgi:hypothetical protein